MVRLQSKFSALVFQEGTKSLKWTAIIGCHCIIYIAADVLKGSSPNRYLPVLGSEKKYKILWSEWTENHSQVGGGVLLARGCFFSFYNSLHCIFLYKSNFNTSIYDVSTLRRVNVWNIPNIISSLMHKVKVDKCKCKWRAKSSLFANSCWMAAAFMPTWRPIC